MVVLRETKEFTVEADEEDALLAFADVLVNVFSRYWLENTNYTDVIEVTMNDVVYLVRPKRFHA